MHRKACSKHRVRATSGSHQTGVSASKIIFRITVINQAFVGRWFGLILLPCVSFAADGFVAVTYFIRHMFRHFFREPAPPTALAKAEAIDLSIQFTLFWMPFLVLLGWWTHKPLTLLFGAHVQGSFT